MLIMFSCTTCNINCYVHDKHESPQLKTAVPELINYYEMTKY